MTPKMGSQYRMGSAKDAIQTVQRAEVESLQQVQSQIHPFSADPAAIL